VPSSSFCLANAIIAYLFIGFMVVPLRAVVSSILPHRCAPPDIFIFYLAPLAILSSILPHGFAPPAYCFLFNPMAMPFWQNEFLFDPTVAPLKAKFYL
jgi:hypothetical protein